MKNSGTELDEDDIAFDTERRSFAPNFDPNRYRAHLSEFELTEAQETELLQIIWGIMLQFVQLGWGADSLQAVLPMLLQSSASPEREAEIEENTGERARA